MSHLSLVRAYYFYVIGEDEKEWLMEIALLLVGGVMTLLVMSLDG